jgi:hypothetical protein
MHHKKHKKNKKILHCACTYITDNIHGKGNQEFNESKETGPSIPNISCSSSSSLSLSPPPEKEDFHSMHDKQCYRLMRIRQVNKNNDSKSRELIIKLRNNKLKLLSTVNYVHHNLLEADPSEVLKWIPHHTHKKIEKICRGHNINNLVNVIEIHSNHLIQAFSFQEIKNICRELGPLYPSSAFGTQTHLYPALMHLKQSAAFLFELINNEPIIIQLEALIANTDGFPTIGDICKVHIHDLNRVVNYKKVNSII